MNHPKSILSIILFALFLGTAVFASDNEPINESNWVNHPQIREIRLIHMGIEEDIKAKRLRELHNDLEYDNPGIPSTKIIYVDKANNARKFIEEWSSGDSLLNCSYYYDKYKVLRFVFMKGGAVNGSEMEHRIYFDPNGKRIWENQKYLKRPGYTFPDVWPEDELIKDPWREFWRKKSSY